MYLLTENGRVPVDPEFAAEVRARSHQPVERCYQCKKCTAGCPVAAFADYQPNQLLRLVQFGQRERALAAAATWRCLSCETCGERCPNGIHLSEVIDVLRQMALAAGVSGDRPVSQFHQSFMGTVRRYGRTHELGMLAEYKLKTRQLFSDLDIGVKMLLKGKLKFLPERVRGLAMIRTFFDRARREVRP
jgi:heterodisulfide reductase subunit C